MGLVRKIIMKVKYTPGDKDIIMGVATLQLVCGVVVT